MALSGLLSLTSSLLSGTLSGAGSILAGDLSCKLSSLYKYPVVRKSVAILAQGEASGANLPVVARTRQIWAPIAAMDVSALDPCGVSLIPLDAYQKGLLVHLRVIEVNQIVVAQPIHPGVGVPVVHCQFPAWVRDRMEVGSEFSLVNFLAEGDENQVLLVGKSSDRLPIMHPKGNDAKVAEAFFWPRWMDSWSQVEWKSACTLGRGRQKRC